MDATTATTPDTHVSNKAGATTPAMSPSSPVFPRARTITVRMPATINTPTVMALYLTVFRTRMESSLMAGFPRRVTFSDDGPERFGKRPDDEAQRTHPRCPTLLVAVGKGGSTDCDARYYFTIQS